MQIEIYRDNLEARDISDNKKCLRVELIAVCENMVLVENPPLAGKLNFPGTEIPAGIEPGVLANTFCADNFAIGFARKSVVITEHQPGMTSIHHYYLVKIPAPCKDLASDNLVWIDKFTLLEIAEFADERNFLALVNTF